MLQKKQPYLAILYKAAFIMGYYGLLRIGELSQGPHVLLAKNVHIGQNKNKILLILESSKTHNKSDKPQLIKITGTLVNSEKKADCCPFTIIKEFVDIRPNIKNNSEQFFVLSDRSPLKPTHLAGTLKSMISTLSLNPKFYSVHGIRTGRAGDLLDLGVSVETIKKLGRWKSNAVFTYLCN